MLHDILPADIEDDGHLRLQCDDVRKVLIRSDPEINAARLRLLQVLQDVLKRGFIRYEVVRTEVTTAFRELRDEVPERFIAELFRQFLSCDERARSHTQRADKGKKCCRGHKKDAASNRK